MRLASALLLSCTLLGAAPTRADDDDDDRRRGGWHGDREIHERAQELGADAVVGLDIDYEVLGADNGMLMVSVSGTAVTLK